MPNSKLPQRDPFVGPPRTYSGAPGDVVELFADAVRQWGGRPQETSLCRDVAYPGTGDHERTEVMPDGAC